MEPKETPPSAESGGPGYAVAHALVRSLLALFYRRIEVVGLENVPATGGLVVAANHHNSVVDAMLLIARVPRRVRTLANAPLFRHVLIGPFLRLVGALPVHRRQEAGTDPARNADLFAATTATLCAGGAIAIFPEGRTQPEPVLLELRTGAARMLLAAAMDAANPAVNLLPVALVFNAPGTFREGEAVVLIGPPLPTADTVALARSEPERAARELTDNLAATLRGMIVEADDRQTLGYLRLAEELWREKGGEVPADPAGEVAWLRSAMRAYRLLRERAPEPVAAFRQYLAEWVRDAERTGLAGLAGFAPPTPTRLLGQAAALLLLAPPALVGMALHIVPYQLTGWGVRRMHATDEEEATDKIAIGLLLFPLAWALEAWGALHWGGGWAVVAFLALLFPIAFVALEWDARRRRLVRNLRAFAACRHDPGLSAKLLARRRELAAELRELAREVPEERPGLADEGRSR